MGGVASNDENNRLLTTKVFTAFIFALFFQYKKKKCLMSQNVFFKLLHSLQSFT